MAGRWLDWLAGAGCTFWQTLPLGPTGYGDSPYFCFSAFAGNPYLVSPDLLAAEGFLDAADLAAAPDFPADRVDFGRVIPWKLSLLDGAFARFQNAPPGDSASRYRSFRRANAGWLDDYARVMDASIAADPDGTDDDELALPEPGRPLTYGGVTVDPFDEPEDDLLPSDDVDDPDGLCNETEGDSSQQDPDIDDALRRAFSRSIKAAPFAAIMSLWMRSARFSMPWLIR